MQRINMEGGADREATGQDQNAKRRMDVFFSADVVMMFTALMFCAYNLRHARIVVGAIQGAGGILYLVLAVAVFFNRRLLKQASWVLVITTTGFMLGALIFSNLHISNLVWMLLPYFLSMFLLGLRNGAILSLLYFSGAVIAVFARLGVVENTLAFVNQISITVANVFAFLFAVGYEKARSENEKDLLAKNRAIETMSYLDGLTGLFNRRFFDRALHQEFHRAKRDNMPLGLIVLDIDFFKNYNDTCGHVQGDACLGDVAETIRTSIARATDTATRFGGDEFALLLPNTDLKGAATIAQRIRDRMARKAVPHPASGISGTITLSLGVAVLSQEEDREPSDLVRRADRALYASKTGGRDRMTFA